MRKKIVMESYALMIQADPDDQYLTESILSEIDNGIQVRFIRHYSEIGNLIDKYNEPAVILLNDLGPTHRGLDLLKQIKTDPLHAHIPVVMLGEISTDDYIRKSYLAGANTFITKPSTINATRKKIETFFEYWFNVAE